MKRRRVIASIQLSDELVVVLAPQRAAHRLMYATELDCHHVVIRTERGSRNAHALCEHCA